MHIDHKNNKRAIIIIAVIAALLIGGGTAFAVMQHSKATASNKSSSEQKSAKKSASSKSNKKKSDKKPDDASSEIADEVAAANNSTGNDDPTNGGHTPIQYESRHDSSNSNQLSGNISTFSLSGGTLTIRVTFDQIIGGNATCNLTLTGPTGQTYTDTARVINDPQSSSCEGWDISTSKLGQTSGRWKASISVTTGDNKSGTITGEEDL